MRALIVFHIGPVQDFIAAARRSRDLWFGSKLLSELARTAAETLVKIENTHLDTLIFPAPGSLAELQSTNFNAPNKIVAVVSGAPHAVAQQVENAIREQLRQLRDEAFGRIPGKFDRTTAEKQVDDMLEFYWVAVPYDENRYAECRRQAETLMAFRKNTREFQPASWGSDAFKSSLDGARESVIDGSIENLSVNELYKQYGVRRGERLCGVGLLKRWGQIGDEERFFSTPHISALPLLERLTEANRAQVEEYIQLLERLMGRELEKVPKRRAHPIFGEYDALILYEGQLAERIENQARLEEAKLALRKLLQEAFGGATPTPYYAILLADGDRMGETIDRLTTPDAHRRFSQQLSQFAGQARQIVEAHQGALIYSGGDDVLALMPLHTILECAKKLAEQFRSLLQEFGQSGQSPTLSVGITIVHHLEPLSDALELARQTEREAKSVSGKNALAITLSKRSGIDRTVKGNWGELDARLEQFIEYNQQERLPEGVAYELQDLARTLEELGAGMREALIKEALRILKRKRARRGEQEVEAKMMEWFKQTLQNGVCVSDLAQELIVASELAKAKALAQPKQGKVATHAGVDD